MRLANSSSEICPVWRGGRRGRREEGKRERGREARDEGERSHTSIRIR